MPKKATSRGKVARRTGGSPPKGLLLEQPEPRLLIKVFHKARIPVWEGRVLVDDIKGWVKNERINVLVKKYAYDFGRPPNNKELYELLLKNDREFKIKQLSRSIFWNGVKVPIILDNDGTLLDGNRRYFASVHLLKSNPENREDFESVWAYVLSDGLTAEDKRKIIIEANFVDDGKIDWSSYVQALQVWREYTVLKVRDTSRLSERFGWPVAKITEAIETMELVREFISYHSEAGKDEEGMYRLGDAMEAELRAAEHYVKFWEARNKYGSKFDEDPDFKEWFFEAMAMGVLRGITQVRSLWQCWGLDDAREQLKSRTHEGVKRAIAIKEAHNLGIPLDSSDEVVKFERAEKRVLNFVKWVNEKLGVGGLKQLGETTLGELRETLQNVAGACEGLRREKT